MPVGYLTVDLAGRMYDLNPLGASLLHLGEEEKNANFFSFFSSSDDTDAVLLLFRRILEDRRPDSIEVNMKHLEGNVFVGALHAAPVESGEGKGKRLRVAFRDVTARKKIEESLRLQQMELESNRVELQELMAKLFTAQEEERRRIACDLHDDHCQRITALILEASAMEKLIRTVIPSLVPRMSALKIKLSDILDDFRHMTHELHPRHLDTVSLSCSMRTYIKEFSEYTGLDVDFQEQEMRTHLPMPITICLYRLLQESLGNIRKHANAKHVMVRLSGAGNQVELRVSDDGSGFNFAEKKPGLGLTSMQERVRPLRGRVAFESKQGHGTMVAVKIPVPSEL
jgi:PAS domain S-box-containing protein